MLFPKKNWHICALQQLIRRLLQSDLTQGFSTQEQACSVYPNAAMAANRQQQKQVFHMVGFLSFSLPQLYPLPPPPSGYFLEFLKNIHQMSIVITLQYSNNLSVMFSEFPPFIFKKSLESRLSLQRYNRKTLPPL